VGNKGDGINVSSVGARINNCSIDGNQNGVSLRNLGYPSNASISNCFIFNSRQYGIALYSSGVGRITNNLLKANKSAGIYCENYDSPVVLNNTIVVSENGLLWQRWHTATPVEPVVKNNIIAFNQKGIVFKPGSNTTRAPQIDFNDLWSNSQGDYEGCSKGSHDIAANPLFVSGSKGEYYLSQISAGQQVDSLCVDAGSTTAAGAGLGDYVTNSNYLRDTGAVDMGYHYPAPLARIVAIPISSTGIVSGRTPLGVQFYGDSSQGEVVSYLWNFGNGATARTANTSQTFVHSSRTAKTYTVTLTVVDKDGISASTSMQVQVKPRAMSWFGMGGD
jgi:parallel beta-helix repeat protein